MSICIPFVHPTKEQNIRCNINQNAAVAHALRRIPEEIFHEPMAVLNTEFNRNIWAKSVTLETSQEPMPVLKDVARANIWLILATLDTSQELIS